MSHEQYRAGACNIGGRERRQRRLLGYGSLLAGVAYLAAVVALSLDPVYAAGVGAFVYGGVLGVLQARERFCVAYGMAGQYGFDDGSGSVADSAQRSRDRKRAVVLSAKAGAVAILAAVGAYGLLGVL
jgi:hypothetical protein